MCPFMCNYAVWSGRTFYLVVLCSAVIYYALHCVFICFTLSHVLRWILKRVVLICAVYITMLFIVLPCVRYCTLSWLCWNSLCWTFCSIMCCTLYCTVCYMYVVLLRYVLYNVLSPLPFLNFILLFHLY